MPVSNYKLIKTTFDKKSREFYHKTRVELSERIYKTLH